MNHYEKKAQKVTDDKERAGAKTNAKVVGIVGVAMATMFTIMQGFMIYGSYNDAISGAKNGALPGTGSAESCSSCCGGCGGTER